MVRPESRVHTYNLVVSGEGGGVHCTGGGVVTETPSPVLPARVPTGQSWSITIITWFDGLVDNCRIIYVSLWLEGIVFCIFREFYFISS